LPDDAVLVEWPAGTPVPAGHSDADFWQVDAEEDGILPYWELYDLPAPDWADASNPEEGSGEGDEGTEEEGEP
jgi:hypothetical protein